MFVYTMFTCYLISLYSLMMVSVKDFESPQSASSEIKLQWKVLEICYCIKCTNDPNG